MELGLFMMPLHDQRRNYTEVLKQDREAIILADRLDFKEVWVGEHTTCSCEPIADPLQFFATLVHATKQIKFATGVLNVPQHHPARLASQIAQFDHLSEGRYIMGVGVGGLVTDIELYGTADKNRVEMTVESIKMMHQIWSQNAPYNIKGKYWDIVVDKTIIPSLGFGPMLKPYQHPFPELAISVMSPNSSSARQAGENNWSIVSANFTPTANVKTHWEQYVVGSEKAGRRPDRKKWRIARSIFVADSDADAKDYLAEPSSSVRWYYDYIVEDMKAFKMLGVLKPTMNTLDSDVTAQNCLDWMVISGSPKTVTDKLVAFIDDVGGPVGKLLMTQKDWDKPNIHRRSMELLATQVMPKLSQHYGSLKAAE